MVKSKKDLMVMVMVMIVQGAAAAGRSHEGKLDLRAPIVESRDSSVDGSCRRSKDP